MTIELEIDAFKAMVRHAKTGPKVDAVHGRFLNAMDGSARDHD